MNKMEDNRILVSVCVITYNSRNTVLETLDSIYAQSYSKLELIISDDCSTDDTVDICKKWLVNHKDRFVNSKIVIAAKNGGTGKNDNMAFSLTSGEWIKPIAGDDLLLPNCISDNVVFVTSNPDVNVVFSMAQIIKTVDGKSELTGDYLLGNAPKQYCALSAEEQYKQLLYFNYIPSVTMFLRRDFVMANPIPETYPYLEDWPYWLRITKKGIRLFFFEKDTVLYRVGYSPRHIHDKSFVYPKFFDSLKAFFYSERYYALMEQDPSTACRLRKEFLLGEIAVVLLKNKRNLISRGLLMVFKILLGVRKLP